MDCPQSETYTTSIFCFLFYYSKNTVINVSNIITTNRNQRISGEIWKSLAIITTDINFDQFWTGTEITMDEVNALQFITGIQD